MPQCTLVLPFSELTQLSKHNVLWFLLPVHGITLICIFFQLCYLHVFVSLVTFIIILLTSNSYSKKLRLMKGQLSFVISLFNTNVYSVISTKQIYIQSPGLGLW